MDKQQIEATEIVKMKISSNRYKKKEITNILNISAPTLDKRLNISNWTDKEIIIINKKLK